MNKALFFLLPLAHHCKLSGPTSKKKKLLTWWQEANCELLKTEYVYVHVIKTEEQLSFMEGPARLLQYEQDVGITELCLYTHVFSHCSWKKVATV